MTAQRMQRVSLDQAEREAISQARFDDFRAAVIDVREPVGCIGSSALPGGSAARAPHAQHQQEIAGANHIGQSRRYAVLAATGGEGTSS